MYKRIQSVMNELDRLGIYYKVKITKTGKMLLDRDNNMLFWEKENGECSPYGDCSYAKITADSITDGTISTVDSIGAIRFNPKENKDREISNRVDVHKTICERLTTMYEKKNSDYGNAFCKVREQRNDALLVRLFDKIYRLESLMDNQKERKVKDESINDTLEDMANYCIMELIEREREGKL